MALKSFNVQGGLTVGTKNVFDANANLNLTSVANVDLGPVANVHISGGNANAGVLGTVSLNGSGNVTSIAITTVGDGYTIPPIITISGANINSTQKISGNNNDATYFIDWSSVLPRAKYRCSFIFTQTGSNVSSNAENFENRSGLLYFNPGCNSNFLYNSTSRTLN